MMVGADESHCRPHEESHSHYSYEEGGYICGYEEESIDHLGNRVITKCKMKYKQSKGRLVHIKEFHEKIKFTCPLLTCQRVYTRKWDMRKHFDKYHPDLDFNVEQEKYENENFQPQERYGNENFQPQNQSDTLTCNVMISKSKDEYGHRVVNYCRQQFSNMQAKIQHQRECHTQPKTLKCQQEGCNEMFDRPFKVKLHMEKHHPNLEFKYELHVKQKKEGNFYYDGVDKPSSNTKCNTPICDSPSSTQKPMYSSYHAKKRSKLDFQIQEICSEVLEQVDNVKLICNKPLNSLFFKRQHLKIVHKKYLCIQCHNIFTSKHKFYNHGCEIETQEQDMPSSEEGDSDEGEFADDILFNADNKDFVKAKKYGVRNNQNQTRILRKKSDGFETSSTHFLTSQNKRVAKDILKNGTLIKKSENKFSKKSGINFKDKKEFKCDQTGFTFEFAETLNLHKLYVQPQDYQF